jgi:L-rhamnose 1-dehydrogenase
MLPLLSLTNKVFIVTGGSLGMGREIALAIARAGAKVTVNYYPDDATQTSHVQSLHDEFSKIHNNENQESLLTIAGDISLKATSEQLVQKTVEKFGRIDGLVCNAGIYPRSDFTSTPEALYRKTLGINLDGTFFASQAVGSYMQSQQISGSIVGISSMTALSGAGQFVHYTASKAGVMSVMNSAAVALGPSGIRCNTVLPGTFDTDGNHAHLRNEEYSKDMLSRIPLRRFGQPSDIAGLVVFLLSDLSTYITGSHIVIDGGALMFNQ